MKRLLAYAYLKKFIVFAPAPISLVILIFSMINSMTPSVCGAYQWEMPLMWLIMTLAHSLPWIAWWEVKRCPRGCGCDSSL